MTNLIVQKHQVAAWLPFHCFPQATVPCLLLSPILSNHLLWRHVRRNVLLMKEHGLCLPLGSLFQHPDAFFAHWRQQCCQSFLVTQRYVLIGCNKRTVFLVCWGVVLSELSVVNVIDGALLCVWWNRCVSTRARSPVAAGIWLPAQPSRLCVWSGPRSICLHCC